MLKHLFPLGLAMVFGAQAMADETDIRKAMEAKLGTKVESVTKSGYMGLYEVYADGQLLYTDEKMTTIIVGGQLIDGELEDGVFGMEGGGDGAGTVQDHEMWSLFAEDNWKLSDDLAILLSGRYDHSDDFGGKFSPKIYAVYDLTPTLALKGGFTTGYKTPSLRSAATDFGSTSMGGVIIGNPDLKPETTRNVELGLNYSDPAGGLSGSLTVYRSKFQDKLLRTGRICAQNVICEYGGVTYPAHQFGYTTYTNVDSAELKGVEWTTDWKINDVLTYRHSYTYAKSEQTSGQFIGRPLNDIPEHMLNLSLEWLASSRLTLWTQINYRGETSGRSVASSGSGTNDLTYPAYTFVDVGSVYDVSRDVTLRFGIYNLFNRTVTPEEGFAYVLDGRRFSAAVSMRF